MVYDIGFTTPLFRDEVRRAPEIFPIRDSKINKSSNSKSGFRLGVHKKKTDYELGVSSPKTMPNCEKTW